MDDIVACVWLNQSFHLLTHRDEEKEKRSLRIFGLTITTQKIQLMIFLLFLSLKMGLQAGRNKQSGDLFFFFDLSRWSIASWWVCKREKLFCFFCLFFFLFFPQVLQNQPIRNRNQAICTCKSFSVHIRFNDDRYISGGWRYAEGKRTVTAGKKKN